MDAGASHISAPVPNLPGAPGSAGRRAFEMGQADSGQLGLQVEVTGGHVQLGAGVPGLQQQRGGDETVIGHRQVQPARQAVRPRLDVLEHRPDVPGHARALAHVPVVPQRFQPPLGLPGRLPPLLPACRPA